MLLDTHVLLWLLLDAGRLGTATRSALGGNDLVVSAASLWEVAIKKALGRLEAPSLRPVLLQQGVPELALTGHHAEVAGALPMHHRDPFDRALVAQAQVEGLVLVTADTRVHAYDVAVLDARR